MYRFLFQSFFQLCFILQQTSQSNKNARKTPKRAYKIKGWGDSPRGRKKKKDAPAAKDTKENNLSWFENDAVYGFFD